MPLYTYSAGVSQVFSDRFSGRFVNTNAYLETLYEQKEIDFKGWVGSILISALPDPKCIHNCAVTINAERCAQHQDGRIDLSERINIHIPIKGYESDDDKELDEAMNGLNCLATRMKNG